MGKAASRQAGRPAEWVTSDHPDGWLVGRQASRDQAAGRPAIQLASRPAIHWKGRPLALSHTDVYIYAGGALLTLRVKGSDLGLVKSCLQLQLRATTPTYLQYQVHRVLLY